MSVNWWSFFLTVISMSFSGIALFILYLVIGKIFKNRLSPHVYYVILILVILRMVVPYSPDFSLMNKTYHNLTVSSSNENPNNSGIRQGRGESLLQSFLQADTHVPTYTIHDDFKTEKESITRSISSWKNTIVVIWLSVAVAIFLFNTLGYFIWQARILSRADYCILHKKLLVNLMGKKRRLSVMVSKRVNTPMLVGVIDPVILLPCEDYSDAELNHILRHELRHFYRHDTAVKWLVIAARSLHWFNPLMPLIVREVNEMCEYSCDRSITYYMNTAERKAYIRTILKTATKQSNLFFTPTASLSNSAKRLERRFISISKQTYFSPIRALAAVTAICLVLITGVSLGAFQFEVKNKRPSQSSPISNTEKISLAPSSPYAPRRENTVTNVWYRYGYERMTFEFTVPDAVFDEKQKQWIVPRENRSYVDKSTLSGSTEDYYFMCSVFKLLNFENYERVGETMTMLYFPGDALQVMFYNELYFYLDKGGDLLVWLDFQYIKNHPHSRDYPDYLEQEHVISVYHVPDELYDEVTDALYHYAIEHH